MVAGRKLLAGHLRKTLALIAQQSAGAA